MASFNMSAQGTDKFLMAQGVYTFIIEDVKVKTSQGNEQHQFFNLKVKRIKDDGSNGGTLFHMISIEHPNKQYLEREHARLANVLYAALEEVRDGIEFEQMPDLLIGKSVQAKVSHTKDNRNGQLRETLNDFATLTGKRREVKPTNKKKAETKNAEDIPF